MAFNDPFATAQVQAQARAVEVDAGLRAYMLRIYNYMASALVLTGIIAMFGAQSEALLSMLYKVQDGAVVGFSTFGWIVNFAPVGVVLWMGMGQHRLSVPAMQALFWGYSILVGLSFTSLFLVYTGESIARVFFITAGMFGGMSLFGYTTKKDLSGWGNLFIMGIWGVFLAVLVNGFLIKSAGFSFLTSVVAVVLFTGLIAYDTQKLKSVYYQAGAYGGLAKASIMGALNLYIDFIGVFIHLMRIMGNRR